jgi:hypothetical protein
VRVGELIVREVKSRPEYVELLTEKDLEGSRSMMRELVLDVGILAELDAVQ